MGPLVPYREEGSGGSKGDRDRLQQASCGLSPLERGQGRNMRDPVSIL